MGGHGKLIWIFISFFIGWNSGYTDPTLTPESVSDYHGNLADHDDVIAWAGIPQGKPYKSEVSGKEDAYIVPYYNMVDGFTNAVQYMDPPLDLILSLLTTGIDISSEINTLLKYGAGIGLCFLLGILFVIVMPIVGCCCCCCRLCGRCGARIDKTVNPRSTCYCKTYTVLLLIISALMSAGIVLVYFTNESAGQGFVKFSNSTKHNLDDLQIFLDNMAQEVDFVVVDGFEFTASVIYRDLDNREYLLGLPVRQRLDDRAGITKDLDTIRGFDLSLVWLLGQINKMNGTLVTLQQSELGLLAELNRVRNNFATISSVSGCGTSCQDIVIDQTLINMATSFQMFGDLTAYYNDLEDVQRSDLSGTAEAGMSDFFDIPRRIDNQTTDVAEDVKRSINDFTTDLGSSLDMISSLQSSITAPLSDIKNSLVGFLGDTETVNTYRFYGCVSLVVVLTLILVLQVTGTFGVICYYDPEVEPMERSDSSHKMGNLLMASAGLYFMFSWLLMLLVMFPFLVGVVLERNVCDQLTDLTSDTFQLLDTPDGALGEGYFLGGLLLQDTDVPLTVSQTLIKCKNNETAYEALMLSNVMNLEEVTNYQSMNISELLNDMSVDFSNIRLLSSETEDLLDTYSRGIKLDYDNLKYFLREDTLYADLDDFAASIRAVANDGTTGYPAMYHLLAVANDLESVNRALVPDTVFFQNEMLDQVLEMETRAKSILTDIPEVEDNLLKAKGIVKAFGQIELEAEIDVFSDRLDDVLQQFVRRVTSGITTEVGKCRPLWTLWESLLHDALCHSFIQPFNGFWFALGWCVFLIIESIIFDLKLAAYIRRMKYKKNKVSPVTTGPGEDALSTADTASTVLSEEGDSIRTVTPVPAKQGKDNRQMKRRPPRQRAGNSLPEDMSRPPSYLTDDPHSAVLGF